MLRFATETSLVSDCEALAAVCMLFDLIDHRDSEIFHRNVTLTLSITEQLIAAEPKVSRTLTGSEVCRRRKEGPLEIGLRPESFEKTRAGLRFGLERLGKSIRIHQRLAWCDLKAAGSAHNEKPFDTRHLHRSVRHGLRHVSVWREDSGISGDGCCGSDPARALHAGTSIAAELLQRDDLGVLAPGKQADIVAMVGNLLIDIAATAKVDFVMKAGQIYRYGTLDILQ